MKIFGRRKRRRKSRSAATNVAKRYSYNRSRIAYNRRRLIARMIAQDEPRKAFKALPSAATLRIGRRIRDQPAKVTESWRLKRKRAILTNLAFRSLGLPEYSECARARSRHNQTVSEAQSARRHFALRAKAKGKSLSPKVRKHPRKVKKGQFQYGKDRC